MAKYQIGQMVMVPAKIVGIHQREDWMSYEVEIYNGEPDPDSDEYVYQENHIIGPCKEES